MNLRTPQHLMLWALLFFTPLVMGAVCSLGPDATDEAQRVVVRALLDQIVEDYLIVTPFATFTPTSTAAPTFTPTPTPTPTPVGGGSGGSDAGQSGSNSDATGENAPDGGVPESSAEATSTSVPAATTTGTATTIPTGSPTATVPPSPTTPPTATPRPTSSPTSVPTNPPSTSAPTDTPPTSTSIPTDTPPTSTSTPTPTNTPAPPVVSFGDANYTVAEGDGSVTVNVQLDKAGSSNISVEYTTGNISAFAPNDYAPKAGTLIFTPGQTNKSFNVSIVDDIVDDPDTETVQLTLSNSVNADLDSGSSATITIQDNDPLPVLQFARSDYFVQESGVPTLTVIMDRPSGKNVNFSYAPVAGGTATENVDYIPLISARTLSPDINGIGPDQAILSWPAIIDDSIFEPNEPGETVLIQLSGVNNATLGSVYTATLYIMDND